MPAIIRFFGLNAGVNEVARLESKAMSYFCMNRCHVRQTFLSAGLGGFPAAGPNTGLESPVNRQARKPALRGSRPRFAPDREIRRISGLISLALLPTLAALHAIMTFGALAAAPESTLRPWHEYRVIMWMNDSVYRQPEKLPLVIERFREMGVNAGMVYGDANPQPIVRAGLPYYVENIVNRGLCLKWNAKVSNWDSFVTAWHKTRDEASLVREYGLDDPSWQSWAQKEVSGIVQKNRGFHPLAYDLRDELSVTLSANPFDYDFSATARQGFRDWLKQQYADLAALNREWNTQFATWDEVKPFTTDQIKNRLSHPQGYPDAVNQPPGQPDWQTLQRLSFDPAIASASPKRWNFAPWADFRSYMDLSLARALDRLRQTAHGLDPETPVGIEGTQMPHAFGGYDLWRLSQALDWVEPYDVGNAREIFGSFMPGKPILTTVFEKDEPNARRRLWHLLLQGDRGCIIWWSEDCLDWKSADYALTSKAKALAPVLRELTGPLAGLFLRAERVYDPIAIHYSQPSIQVDWLIESCADGPTWLRRFSSFEADHNRLVRIRNGWLKAFQDAGFSPRFVSSAQIESDLLAQADYRVLILPGSLALSDKEAERIRAFIRPAATPASHVIFCDGSPGMFDEHGRLRSESALADLFPPTRSEAGAFVVHSHDKTTVREKAGNIAGYASDRLQTSPATDWTTWIATNTASLPREVVVSTPGNPQVASRVATYRYRLGSARLYAFERNINYQMSEDLKQAGGNQNLEQPVDLEVRFAQAGHLYDLRTREYLGQTGEIRFRLDPWQPSLFAVLPVRIPGEQLLNSLSAPAERR